MSIEEWERKLKEFEEYANSGVPGAPRELSAGVAPAESQPERGTQGSPSTSFQPSSSLSRARPASAPRERTARSQPARKASDNQPASLRPRRSRPPSASKAEDREPSSRLQYLAQPRRRHDTRDDSNANHNKPTRHTSYGGPPSALASRRRCTSVGGGTAADDGSECESVTDDGNNANECTFKPHINESAQKLGRLKRRFQAPVEDRLFKEHEEWQEAREDAKRQLKQEELQACTFKPQLGKQSRRLAESTPAASRPLHERVDDVLKRRNAAIAEAQRESEREDEHTFQPAVDHTSARLAQAARAAETEPDDVVERLTDPRKSGRARKGPVAHESENERSFEPQVCPTSNKIVGSLSQVGAFRNDFLERQQEWAEKVEFSRKMQAMDSDDSCTFKPDTGNANAVLARSRHVGRLGETTEERWQRLSSQEAERRNMLIASLAKEQDSKYPFKPQLCETSFEIGHSRDLDELASNDSRLRSREDVARQLDDADGQECTFRPQIKRVPSPNRIGPPEALIDRISELNRQRNAMYQEQKAAAEYEEFSECTFAPETNKKRPKHDGPIVVRGLGRHLELSELRKRKGDERKSKEEQVFHEKPQPPKNGRTVTEPFDLKSEQRDHKRSSQPSGTNFSFRPDTATARRRNIVAAMLK